jgi:hypothetical protein
MPTASIGRRLSLRRSSKARGDKNRLGLVLRILNHAAPGKRQHKIAKKVLPSKGRD